MHCEEQSDYSDRIGNKEPSTSELEPKIKERTMSEEKQMKIESSDLTSLREEFEAVMEARKKADAKIEEIKNQLAIRERDLSSFRSTVSLASASCAKQETKKNTDGIHVDTERLTTILVKYVIPAILILSALFFTARAIHNNTSTEQSSPATSHFSSTYDIGNLS